MKRSKEFEKRKKFVMELLGDPLYKPMRLREIGSLLRLDKGEKKNFLRCWMSFVPREKLKLTTRADTAKPPADIKKEEKRKTVLNPRRRTETAVKETAEKNTVRNSIFLKKTELLWKGLSLAITKVLVS